MADQGSLKTEASHISKAFTLHRVVLMVLSALGAGLSTTIGFWLASSRETSDHDGLVTLGLLVLSVTQLISVLMLGTRLLQAQSQAVAISRRMRKDASRHEWIQERALERIEAKLAGAESEVFRVGASLLMSRGDKLTWSESEPGIPRVLFVTSNGFGMGHITRCLAIARAGQRKFSASVVTLSVAYGLAQSAYPFVRHYPSPDSVPWRRSLWHRQFAEDLQRVILSDCPEVVVFDGTVIYDGLQEACTATRTPIVWIRRGLWKTTADRRQYDAPNRYADLVVVPGDVGESVAGSANVSEVSVVDPIVIRTADDLWKTSDAKESLGLEPGKEYSLIQVGAASVDGVKGLSEYVLRRLRQIDPRVTPVIFESPVSDHAPNGVRVVQGVYPLADRLSAFEYAVTASGYNTVHECIEMSLPTVLVPNQRAVTDDQGQRARNASQLGCALIATTKDELDAALTKLVDKSSANDLRTSLRAIGTFRGASQAAELVAGFASDVMRAERLLTLTEPKK